MLFGLLSVVHEFHLHQRKQLLASRVLIKVKML